MFATSAPPSLRYTHVKGLQTHTLILKLLEWVSTFSSFGADFLGNHYCHGSEKSRGKFMVGVRGFLLCYFTESYQFAKMYESEYV